MLEPADFAAKFRSRAAPSPAALRSANARAALVSKQL
jgi:hypothetical protein